MELSLDDTEAMFGYTFGRFLMNEAEELSQRYQRFSIDGLKAAAVSVVSGGQYCSSFTKIGEGVYNRVFLIKIATWFGSKEVVAKIPYPRAGPSHILTASEVATLEFCRDVLRLPVPKVLGWSSHADSTAVGAEYILMERAEGVHIAERWDELKLPGQLQFGEQLLKVQTRMLGTKFGAFGSLYYRDAIPEALQYRGDLISSDSEKLLSVSNIDLRRWCIGPMADRDFYFEGKDLLDINRGPWTGPLDYTESIIDRQIKWFQESPPPPRPINHPFRRLDSQENPHAHIALLKRFRTMLQVLIPPDPSLTVPVLAHPDLHAYNIFVAASGAPTITCLLDWQDAALKPLFMQAGLPKVLNYVGVSLIRDVPSLPPKSVTDDMPEEEWDAISADFMSKSNHSEYQCKLRDIAPDYYRALSLPGQRAVMDTISSAANTYSTEIFPDIWRLRDRMKQLCEQWDLLGISQPCPVNFSTEELEEHETERLDYQLVAKQFKAFQDLLGMRSDGWVDAKHYAESVAASKKLREYYESEMKGLAAPEELEKYWPLAS
ncbi:Phosphotransferase enzyme [Tulasnella sp. JGI-2019a]|nr:Phosphotransferase enzyme [Tulasnella sp. JGI-2019a]